MATPLLVIGLDGATFRWLDPLVAAGHLPNLARLLQSGARAPLLSTMPPLTPPGWASCLTGVSPRVHGLWDFVRRASAHRYDLLPTTGADVRAPWLWQRLTRPGQRSVVLNLPFSYPARALQGAMVCGFDSIDRRRSAYPTELLDSLEVELGGPYPFFYQVPARHIRKLFPNADKAVNLGAVHEDGILPVVRESQAFTRAKLHAAAHLARLEPFTFFFVHIFETDHLSHEAWNALESPEHPEHGLLLEYLRTLDDGVGELVDAASRWQEPVVALVSDHGFGPNSRRLLLNDWLVEQGLLVLQDAARPNTPQAAPWEQIDWKRTRAYAIQTGIYFNRAETHPSGIVREQDTSALEAEITSSLRQALQHDAQALRVATRAAISSPVRPELAPDLVVHAEADICLMGYGELHGSSFASAAGLEGYHRMEGILVLHGPGIAAGVCAGPVQMVDCAPTFLHLVGEHDHTGLEGRVLTELMTKEQRATARTPMAADVRAPAPQPQALEVDSRQSPEEIDEIVRRLTELGYMG